MRKSLFLFAILFTTATFAADGPAERWAKAIGGRDKAAAVHAIYREGTIEIAGYQGTLKVWHTADGKYRKEEQVATFSNVETFDGANGTVQQNGEPVRSMTPEELQQNRSKRFANSNAMFFVFFPDRHPGARTPAGNDTLIFKPAGGIEWRVTLDPQTSLPKTMVHDEGGRTITVTFTEYETIDGIKLEKEIHRSAGGPMGAVIRFTKTVINPPLNASLFTAAAVESTGK